jgi:hypothetical protein
MKKNKTEVNKATISTAGMGSKAGTRRAKESSQRRLMG